MESQSTTDIKQQLADKLQRLNLLSYNESTFIKLESLFFDVLALARLEGNTENGNFFLTNLKGIQQREFQLTQQSYQKANQREQAIKKFKMALKKEMSSYLKTIKVLVSTKNA